MPRIRVAVTIDAPPDAVWSVLENVERHVDWMEDAAAIRFTSTRRRGVGTTFDCDTRVGPFRLTDHMSITEWKPPRVMGVRHVGLVTGVGRMTLRRRRGGRTWFMWSESLTFPWWMGGRPGALAGGFVLRRIWKRNLENLKELVESA